MYAWNDKGNQQHVEAAEDDVDEQDRHAYGLFQALPLTGSDPDGPTDAEVYLQQVRFVLVCTGTHCGQNLCANSIINTINTGMRQVVCHL